MSLKYLAGSEFARKRRGPLERFATLAGAGPVLLMTARFGRSPVRDAAYRFRAKHRDLDLKLSWRLFAGLEDWGERWPDERYAFAAGLILSAVKDPVVERAVGRCFGDLAQLGMPVLWGVVSGQRIRWHPQFKVSPNGWPPEEWLPRPAAYACLSVTQDTDEFGPEFDPILYLAEPDFFISGSRLRWWEPRHFHVVRRDAEADHG
jgi:hypothetical protein